LAVFDDGTGQAIYAGGQFGYSGGVPLNSIAKWTGKAWSPLGTGVARPQYPGNQYTQVNAFAVFDDGRGPALYAGGRFEIAGDIAVGHIARWDGSTWSALANGMGGLVRALTVFDDGSGIALYAGGSFQSAGGLPVNRIAKWDGKSWSAVGTGVSGFQPFVSALTVFDDGTGPALYAGGGFTGAGGVSARQVARWDGTSWSALGSGLSSGLYDGDPFVYALAAFDDGSGPALFAGGNFTTAGGSPASRIAKWDGEHWSPLGAGMSNTVSGLTVYDDGTGPALYVGGGFALVSGESPYYIAKWDAKSWSSLGTGMNSAVGAMVVFDDGIGPALFAGGWFTSAGDNISAYLAKWYRPAPPCEATDP
jgi:hypothetical protein